MAPRSRQDRTEPWSKKASARHGRIAHPWPVALRSSCRATSVAPYGCASRTERWKAPWARSIGFVLRGTAQEAVLTTRRLVRRVGESFSAGGRKPHGARTDPFQFIARIDLRQKVSGQIRLG